MDKNSIGARIREMRERAGLNQLELAAKSKVAVRTIQLIEYGRGNPTIETLEALTKALGYSLEDVWTHIIPDDFYARLTNTPPHILRVVLALVYKDAGYLAESSESVVLNTTKLLKALVAP